MTSLSMLLDDVVHYIRRYVVLTDAQLSTVALWVAHTHAFDAAEATPYLAVSSAEKASGKTRLLETLEPIVARAWFTGRVTAAVLVRKVHTVRPTLLLDESDAAFAGEREYAEALRDILNSGYKQNGTISLCIRRGADWDFVDYSCFCAKAIAGLGDLPDTIASRSIPIRLRRRAPGESTERFRARDIADVAAPIRDRLEAWALSATHTLLDARPELPDVLPDRAADVWEPLLAIADAAGASWSAHAREAAVALSSGSDSEDTSAGVRLLADIDQLFADTDRLSSAVLVARLNALDESPWAEWGRGRGLTQSRLARVLRDFDIRSRSIRLPDGTTPKGFLRAQFVDAFTRYLPQAEAHNATPPQPTLEEPSGRDADRHGHVAVAGAEKAHFPHQLCDVAAVAVYGPDSADRVPEVR